MPGYHENVTSYEETVSASGTGGYGAGPIGAPVQGGYVGYAGGYGGYGARGYGGYGYGPCGNNLGYCPKPKQAVQTRYYTYGIQDVYTQRFSPVYLSGVCNSGPYGGYGPGYGGYGGGYGGGY